MTISKDIYQQFEMIVGKENISDDPAVLDSYRYPLSQTAIHLGPYYNTYTPRGLAVLLPGTTEEVQAIVKLCNKNGFKLKAATTFWSAMGYPSEDNNTIQLDMRRMDKIIEINQKNMYAVVEPGVISAMLQAEVMKVGLNCHIQGSGSSCSPLASSTSYNGPGPSTIYMGSNSDNLLALEWVMPDGEIMRTGSLGSRIGWFCGEGPGPSLRGIMRGGLGAKGAMGVFTKVALKLHPWPGPDHLPVTGTVPAYQAALPDNFRAYTLAFPSWQAWANTCYAIWDAGVGYIAHRQFNMFGRDLKYAAIKIVTDPTRTLGDIEELLKDPEVQKVTEEMKRDFQIVLAGMTPRDIEWQDKALDQILQKTGGWKVLAMEDPSIKKWSLLYLTRLGHKNLNMIYAGSYDGSFGLPGTPDYGTLHVEEAGEFQAEWEKKGAFVQAGGDSMMGGIGGMGGGCSAGWENFTSFDPHDKESTEGTFEFFEAATKFGLSKGWGPGMERWNAFSRGPNGKTTAREIRHQIINNDPQPIIYDYQRQIRAILDPNKLGDAYYWTNE